VISSNFFVLPVTCGQPGAVRLLHGYGLDGVSCVSASRCYAVGFNNLWSVVTTLSSGKPGSPDKVSNAYLYALACRRTGCTAGGWRLGRGLGVGLAFTASSPGTSKSLTVEKSACCYVSVARLGRFIAAASSTQRTRTSQVTTGG
jgi:hypothetical protein